MKRKTIIEPFRIKSVEPLPFNTREERMGILERAHYNLFLIPSKDVVFDFLTDSGTGAMSASQWASMMVGDESYAGSPSFFRFESTVRNLTGYDVVIPTHQGRAAEKILFSYLVKPGCMIPSNNHFDTTRANIEQLGGQAVDLVIPEGRQPQNPHPFKGNIDLVALEAFCEKNRASIPFGMLTITNNTGGGQPVSLANIRGASEIYKKYGIPFFLDACRFAENSYFIKLRENQQADRTARSIAEESFRLADGCLISAKKDGLVNIGGFLAFKRSALAADPNAVDHILGHLILSEGYPTYGGLAGRDLEALATGLEEVLDEHYLEYRLAVSRYMAEGLNRLGIPTVQPAGGHAVYIDAREFLPHIPPEQFPGQALACELYLSEGIRSCEIGSVMFGPAATMELVRLAFPRRVYTQSHFDYILEGLADLSHRKNEIQGLAFTYEPSFLRHFRAQFTPITACNPTAVETR